MKNEEQKFDELGYPLWMCLPIEWWDDKDLRDFLWDIEVL